METLIDADTLARRLATTAVTVLDVRWDPPAHPRHESYLAAHIPGAVFVDLDRDLAAPPGRDGRHPLPDTEAFTRAMRARGVSAARAVVVYDAATAMAAARAWWLLRYFGHPDVTVLDGGLKAWADAGHPTHEGDVTPQPADFTAHPGAMPVIDAAGAARLAAAGVLIDARAPERYRGEHEPIDPVAGHVPGALNRSTIANIDANGRFKTPRELQRAFAALGITADTRAGAYCGSGVTAAHEVLALTVAGIDAGALYPGSWSEWITDPARPVATAHPDAG